MVMKYQHGLPLLSAPNLRALFPTYYLYDGGKD